MMESHLDPRVLVAAVVGGGLLSEDPQLPEVEVHAVVAGGGPDAINLVVARALKNGIDFGPGLGITFLESLALVSLLKEAAAENLEAGLDVIQAALVAPHTPWDTGDGEVARRRFVNFRDSLGGGGDAVDCLLTALS